MKECVIGIDLALALKRIAKAMKLKAPLGKYGFACPMCGEPVKAFADGMQGPHFEHLDRNMDCELSDT
jgi:hypothetical protein